MTFNYNNDELSKQKTSLVENHAMILEIFDTFNCLLNNRFDCFYTGGLMLFLHNDDNLERYHSDLDIFMNEDQLIDLKNIIDDSSDFRLISNMYKKEVNGHEYKILYKDYPISIGLFLFERKTDGGIITKKYYYEDLPNMKELCVDERHFNSAYANLVFCSTVFYHNKMAYKMVAPEFIYYSKLHLKPHRNKDDYDILYAKDKIDNDKVNKINIEKQKKIDIIHKKLYESIIFDIEYNIDSDAKVYYKNKKNIFSTYT